jgi:hypothetical protein
LRVIVAGGRLAREGSRHPVLAGQQRELHRLGAAAQEVPERGQRRPVAVLGVVRAGRPRERGHLDGVTVENAASSGCHSPVAAAVPTQAMS